jgi:hypothetical protein
MNRSYSKIRHIQESNQRLENRLLNEDTESVESSIKPCQAFSTCQGKTFKVTAAKRQYDLVMGLLTGSGGLSGYGNIAKWTQINDTSKHIPNEPIGLVPSKDFPINAGSKFAFVFNLKGKQHLTLWLDSRCTDSCPLIHYDSNGNGKSSVPYPIMIDSEYSKLITTLKKDISNVKD